MCLITADHVRNWRPDALFPFLISFRAYNVMVFYRAMHYSAKRSLAIACRLSVCLSVCNVGGSWPQRLKILETNCADN